ncbi:hypothetical protein LCGC14_3161350, partial [marine sediment metagenome]
FTTVISATAVTGEKESRCWPLLLCTTLTDGHILWGKVVGVIRRCWPGWVFVPVHLLLFTLFGLINPVAWLHLAVIATSVMMMLTGSGLYFSARFRRTTTAVTVNMGLVLGLWVALPILLAILSQRSEVLGDLTETAMSANPVVQAYVVTEGAGGAKRGIYATRRVSFDYDWPDSEWDAPKDTTGIVMSTGVVHVVIGLLFAWRAKCCFRRGVF